MVHCTTRMSRFQRLTRQWSSDEAMPIMPDAFSWTVRASALHGRGWRVTEKHFIDGQETLK